MMLARIASARDVTVDWLGKLPSRSSARWRHVGRGLRSRVDVLLDLGGLEAAGLARAPHGCVRAVTRVEHVDTGDDRFGYLGERNRPC
jgi:hypothetical protein